MSTKPSNLASLEAVRDLIGKPLRRSQHNRLVSASSVKRWAKSIGDRNPLWLDSDYAGRTPSPFPLINLVIRKVSF